MVNNGSSYKVMVLGGKRRLKGMIQILKLLSKLLSKLKGMIQIHNSRGLFAWFLDPYFWPGYSSDYILGLNIPGSISSLKVLFLGLRSFVSAATTSATAAPRTLLHILPH